MMPAQANPGQSSTAPYVPLRWYGMTQAEINAEIERAIGGVGMAQIARHDERVDAEFAALTGKQ